MTKIIDIVKTAMSFSDDENIIIEEINRLCRISANDIHKTFEYLATYPLNKLWWGIYDQLEPFKDAQEYIEVLIGIHRSALIDECLKLFKELKNV